MPQFPPAYIDDVEAQNQRNFAALGQRQMSSDALIVQQSNHNFVTSNNLMNAAIASAYLGADTLNAQILGTRAVRDQPQTTGGFLAPGVYNTTPGPGDTTPSQKG